MGAATSAERLRALSPQLPPPAPPGGGFSHPGGAGSRVVAQEETVEVVWASGEDDSGLPPLRIGQCLSQNANGFQKV